MASASAAGVGTRGSRRSGPRRLVRCFSMDSASSGKRVMTFADRVRCPLPALLVCSAVVTSSFASDASAVRPVPVTANRVTIDDAFWSPKLKTWRAVTIKDCLDKFERDGAFRNFDHVARDELDAPHGGPQWYDGLIYELIGGAADLMAQEPDAALEARIDGYIDRISAAAAVTPTATSIPIRKCANPATAGARMEATTASSTTCTTSAVLSRPVSTTTAPRARRSCSPRPSGRQTAWLR